MRLIDSTSITDDLDKYIVSETNEEKNNFISFCKRHHLEVIDFLKILRFTETQFHGNGQASLFYMKKKKSGLCRKIVIDMNDRSVSILSNKKQAVVADTKRKHVSTATKVHFTYNKSHQSYDNIQINPFVRIQCKEADFDPQEISLLTQQSGLATSAFYHQKSKQMNILQEAGVDLEKFMEQSPSLKRMNKVFLQLATNLRQLHAQNIVHGDIKRQNVVVSAAKKVAIIDFELSRSTKDSKYHNDQYGTWRYTAPEILGERNRLWDFDKQEKAEDMYALGCLMYECVYNTMIPWGSKVEKALQFQESHEGTLKSMQEHRQAIGEELKKNLPKVERVLKEAIYACLDPMPKTRLTVDQLIVQLKPELA